MFASLFDIEMIVWTKELRRNEVWLEPNFFSDDEVRFA